MVGWFKWAKRTGRCPENVAENLPRFKRLRPPAIDVFTETEIALLQGLRLPHGVLMHFLFDTGVRRDEALHMRAMDVQFERYRIVVRDVGAKGGEGRTIEADAALLGRLREWFDLDGIGGKDFLWAPNPGGHGYRRYALPGRTSAMLDTSFQTWWTQCLAEAAVTYRKPHTTRHTCATRWLRMGGRRETLRRQLGHKSTRTIDVYEHLDVSDVRADLELIAGRKG
jgi:integrase/recombinase XerD